MFVRDLHPWDTLFFLLKVLSSWDGECLEILNHGLGIKVNEITPEDDQIGFLSECFLAGVSTFSHPIAPAEAINFCALSACS